MYISGFSIDKKNISKVHRQSKSKNTSEIRPSQENQNPAQNRRNSQQPISAQLSQSIPNFIQSEEGKLQGRQSQTSKKQQHRHHAKEKPERKHKSSNKITLNNGVKQKYDEDSQIGQNVFKKTSQSNFLKNKNTNTASSKQKIVNLQRNQSRSRKPQQQVNSRSANPHNRNLYKSPVRNQDIDNFRKNKIHNVNNSKKFIGTTQIQRLQFKSLLEEIKVAIYFRYYPMNLLAACGQKQEMFKSLQQNGDFKVTHFPISKKSNSVKPSNKQLQGVWFKLLKLAQLKGKYKYRQKLNYAYSAQLKAMKYKKKEWKKKKESSSSDSDSDCQKKEKCRDMQTWKKSMGVQGKVFIVKGGYHDFKKALIERGWVQNPDKYSNYFDLKWTTKISDINFNTLKAGQIVNHFDNNACLTSKYGLCKSLRSISYSEQIDIDRYFPRAYDLSDLTDFQNFIQVYKIMYCESLLKRYVESCKHDVIEEVIQNSDQEQCSRPIENSTDPLFILKVKVSIMVTSRRIQMTSDLQGTIDNMLQQKYCLCSVNQWNLIMTPKIQNQYNKDEIIKTWHKYLQRANTLYSQEIVGNLPLHAQKVLDLLKNQDPQYNLNGNKNIWIVKPAFLSRGRGIKCLTELNSILDFSLGKETQYIVQKYIQNPLLINNRKFDIRQWVIIEDYSPPKIWFYGEFYVRFCLQEYNSSKIGNKYAHLTNNSIQKTNKNKNKILKQQNIEQMWTQQQLKQYLQQLKLQVGNDKPRNEQSECQGSKKKSKLSKIIQKMKQVVIASVMCTQDQVYGRKNTFQLVGYDFMIDDKLQPWLIQINSSPSMDQSNQVTKRLCKMVLEDTAKIMVENKAGSTKGIKSKKAGLFKCIYKAQEYKWKHYKIESKTSSNQ